MKRFLIESGELTRVVQAATPEEAAAEAVRQAGAEADANGEAWPRLAQLIMMIEVAEDDLSYIRTETICRAAGLWREDDPRKE